MSIMKKSILEELRNAKTDVAALLSGKSTENGANVDAHIEAAAKLLDAARENLETARTVDEAREISAGHQMRVDRVLEYLRGKSDIGNVSDEDLGVLLRPIAFDASAEVLIREKFWHSTLYCSKERHDHAVDIVNAIFSKVKARANAISVLKIQADKVRKLGDIWEADDALNIHAVTGAIDSVLNALKGWNDDMTQYGE